jgi:hypothetical protein
VLKTPLSVLNIDAAQGRKQEKVKVKFRTVIFLKIAPLQQDVVLWREAFMDYRILFKAFYISSPNGPLALKLATTVFISVGYQCMMDKF